MTSGGSPKYRRWWRHVLRLWLRARDGGWCWLCGKALPMHEDTIDHYLPKALDGTDELINLRLACKGCNRTKANKHPDTDGIWSALEP